MKKILLVILCLKAIVQSADANIYNVRVDISNELKCFFSGVSMMIDDEDPVDPNKLSELYAGEYFRFNGRAMELEDFLISYKKSMGNEAIAHIFTLTNLQKKENTDTYKVEGVLRREAQDDSWKSPTRKIHIDVAYDEDLKKLHILSIEMDISIDKTNNCNDYVSNYAIKAPSNKEDIFAFKMKKETSRNEVNALYMVSDNNFGVSCSKTFKKSRMSLGADFIFSTRSDKNNVSSNTIYAFCTNTGLWIFDFLRIDIGVGYGKVKNFFYSNYKQGVITKTGLTLSIPVSKSFRINIGGSQYWSPVIKMSKPRVISVGVCWQTL